MTPYGTGHASAVRILREVPQTDLMDTTRRYSRSLSEAFPDVRAPAVEVFVREPLGHVVVGWLTRILAVVLVGAISVGVL